MTRFSVVLAGTALAIATLPLMKLGGVLAGKTRQPPAAPRPAETPAAPVVHVHVTPDRPHGTPHVLDRPDHRIYVTTGSALMAEHPECDELLRRLDVILFAAAHRDGNPFTVAPPPDTSTPAGVTPDLLPLAAVDEGEFLGGERQPLPPPDGALWLRRAGTPAICLAVPASS